MAWWKDQEGIAFTRPPYTANDIKQHFMLQEKPIEGHTLFHLLEPLAGTSFMEKAIRELRIHLAGRRRLQPETSVYPYDLYQCWMGDNYPDQVEQVRDFPRQNAATIALHSLSTHAIGIDTIFLLHWLNDPSEMLLMQGRWDEVYYDEERTRKAFSHHAGQWQFYKGGSFLYTIAESKIQYEDDAGLRAPRTKVAGVLSSASTLPTGLLREGKLALVWLCSDFRADALRHGGCPCFGAKTAPLSHVG